MKIIGSILFYCFGQFTLTAQQRDEHFLNAINHYLQFQDCDSMLLLKQKLYFSVDELTTEDIQAKIPKTIWFEFVKKNRISQKSEQLWNVAAVKNAKEVLSKDSLGKIINRDYFVADSLFSSVYHLDTISNWEILERKTDSLESLGIDFQTFKSYGHCYGFTTMLSYPLISENGKWAIQKRTLFVANLHCSGAIYIYKKRKKHWKSYGITGNWVS